MMFAFGVGIGTKNSQGSWLEVFFPSPFLGPKETEWKAWASAVGYNGGNQTIEIGPKVLDKLSSSNILAESLHNSKQPVVAVFLEADEDPVGVPDTYLKLHLISHRLVKPHGTKLAGIFKVLPNVAWTNKGAIDPTEVPQMQLDLRLKGKTLTIHSIDKFPKLTDYVIPSGVRIADASRVRLGAYLGTGTTIMHEGFVNFNAGCDGPNMIEGRISAGVLVGSGSDLGGGCSTMGTLSGGNNVVIAIGKNCLIGANAGVGIGLGDNCTVEAGLYVTAASKVRFFESAGGTSRSIKASVLSGHSNLLFRRNSQDGAIECLPNKNVIKLNIDLHKND
jgi:2,3,4,5-tetrahydropyridine-2-carboxylate N-succinyltransferase